MTRIVALLLIVSPLVAAVKDLAGLWDFRYDPGSIGEKSEWHNPAAGGHWDKIQTPGSFNQLQDQLSSYRGKAWYRTSFTVPGDHPGGRVVLRFEGVALRSKVWVNGFLVSQHLFPYSGFEIDATDRVRLDASNCLVVLADNEVLDFAIPDLKWSGWWNFGGINRAVYVETRPAVFAKLANIETMRTQEADPWRVAMDIAIANHGAAGAARIWARIEDADGRPVWTAARDAHLGPGARSERYEAAIRGVRPWSPDSPALYRLRAGVDRDGKTLHETTTRFGFRTIATSGLKILLNGEPVVFKGVNLHEMYPGCGMTLSRVRARADLEDIKALGANFVRVAHYPHARHFYELCDELGLMVWNEIPAWQTASHVLRNGMVWETYAAPLLREMVENYRLHPSIVVWSSCNEIESNRTEGKEYVAKAGELLRKLDRTRLVTFASSKKTADLAFGLADFIAVNAYFGHYGGKIEDLGPMLDELHGKWPDKPVVLSEFGTESVLGWSAPGPSPGDGSEDYHARLIADTFGHALAGQRREFMAGMIYWLYADYPWKDDPAWLANRPPAFGILNCKGVVTQDRQHKRSWSTLQQQFRAFEP